MLGKLKQMIIHRNIEIQHQLFCMRLCQKENNPFTIAQSPHELRGLMVGLWYTAHGVVYVITINSKYLFACEDETACQSLYYFIFKSVIILIILIVFLVLAKCYKLCVRENEVNIHLIAEEHYERYMDQEVMYNNELGLSFERVY